MGKRRKTMLGRVVSNKMDKTAVVAVETYRQHPVYKKTVRTVTRYKAQDTKNECQPGDAVRLEETRPLSKEKRWRIAEIVTKVEQIEVRPEELEPQALEPQPEEVSTESESTIES